MRKVKIWNSKDSKWFQPVYPGHMRGKNNQMIQTHRTEEILFSQTGDMYLRSQEGEGSNNLQLLPHEVWICCTYTGIKDRNEQKVYEHDIIQNGTDRWIVVFSQGCWYGKNIDGTHTRLSTLAFEVIGSSLEKVRLLEDGV